MSKVTKAEKAKRSPEQVEAVLAEIDGVMGAADHHVDDPYVRDLYRKQITGELTVEEVTQLIIKHAGL